MNLKQLTRICSKPLAVSIPLVLMLFVACSDRVQASQKSSEELLLEIMDLHSDLVTNEIFLAQAKMLGAYLEAAQPLQETKKVKIYTTVLQIITNIKKSPAQIPPQPSEKKQESQQKTFEAEQKGKSVFEPGAALLEIFKADSIETTPKLPVIRTYWERDLAHIGGFLLPDRVAEVGREARYVAQFSFYYEAKEPGDYGFTLLHDTDNVCKLTIGGVDIVKVARESSAQGVCNLREGFHRLEFWLVSAVPYRYQPERDRSARERGIVETVFEGRYREASFVVRVLTPNALDAVDLTKDMMLLKAEPKKAVGEKQPEKAKRKRIPYINY